MMVHSFPPIRRLLSAGLIVSILLAGLIPQAMRAVDGGGHAFDQAQTVSPVQSARCCCGTEDGRCCATGCCVARQAPPAEPFSLPSEDNNRRGQTNPLTLGLADAVIYAGSTGAAARDRREGADAAGLYAETSLQVRHVRINV